MTENTEPTLEEMTRQLLNPNTPFGIFMQRVHKIEHVKENATKKAMYQYALYDLMGAVDQAEDDGKLHQAEFGKTLAERYAKKAGLEPEEVQRLYTRVERAKKTRYM